MVFLLRIVSSLVCFEAVEHLHEYITIGQNHVLRSRRLDEAVLVDVTRRSSPLGVSRA